MDVVFLFHPLVCLLLQGTFTQCRFLVRTQIPHYFCVFFVRVFVCMCVLHKTTVHVVIIKSFPWLTQVEVRASQTHPVCRCHSLPLSPCVFILLCLCFSPPTSKLFFSSALLHFSFSLCLMHTLSLWLFICHFYFCLPLNLYYTFFYKEKIL